MIDARVGGPQLRSLAIAKRLRKKGIETEFLLPDGDDEFAERARTQGFEVHRPGLSRIQPPKEVLENIKYITRYPLAVHRIRRIILDRSIDVVHANMSLNFDASVAAWRSNAALVWHFNDVLVPWPLNKIAGRTAESLADERVVAAGSVADHYFPASEDVQKLFAPVDLDKFDPNAVTGSGLAEELGGNSETILIGSVGNVNPIKGHEYLIRAAAKINSEIDRDIIVPIAGGILDSREAYFERLKEIRSDLNLDETIQFLGRRPDIAELLAQFDVFVLPSIAEACPMAVLEAMAMEKPIIASNVGGIPEQITDGESGWLVPSKDPDALAAAISEALNDEGERQRRAQKARERSISAFSLERCAERHLQVYRQVCE